jgi:hypothetical protein
VTAFIQELHGLVDYCYDILELFFGEISLKEGEIVPKIRNKEKLDSRALISLSYRHNEDFTIQPSSLFHSFLKVLSQFSCSFVAYDNDDF